MFGTTVTNSDGREVPVRWVGEQHVKEDLGRIPTACDWLRAIKPEAWMMRAGTGPVDVEQGGLPAIDPATGIMRRLPASDSEA